MSSLLGVGRSRGTLVPLGLSILESIFLAASTGHCGSVLLCANCAGNSRDTLGKQMSGLLAFGTSFDLLLGRLFLLGDGLLGGILFCCSR